MIIEYIINLLGSISINLIYIKIKDNKKIFKLPINLKNNHLKNHDKL